MTPDGFRRIAISMPGAVEASHMGHPDFRVGGKIFATMGWPDDNSAMVKLTPEQQAMFVAAEPNMFAPVSGGWGRRGSTNVRLAAVNTKAAKQAVQTAWGNIAGEAATRARTSTTAAAKSGAKKIKNKSANAASDDISAKTCPYAASGSAADLDRAFARVRAVIGATNLPGIEGGTSFGTPSLKVRGKLLTRLKDEDTLVVRCPLEEKSLLLEAAPDIYFETDHYKGWPAVLVRLSKINDVELRHRLERAWRLQAPTKLVNQLNGEASTRSKLQRTLRVRSS